MDKQRVSRIARTALLWLALAIALILLSLISGLLPIQPVQAQTHQCTIAVPEGTAVTMGDTVATIPFTITNITGTNPIIYVRLAFDPAIYHVSEATVAPPGWYVARIRNGFNRAWVEFESDSAPIQQGESLTFDVTLVGGSGQDAFPPADSDRPDSLSQSMFNRTRVKWGGGNRDYTITSWPTWQRVGLALSITAVPSSVAVTDTIKVTLNVTNRSNRVDGQANITPTLSYTGTGGVTLVSGPLPPEITLAAGSSGVFTYTYRATATGEVTFNGSASNANVTSKPAESNVVVIGDFTALLEVQPETIIAGQQVQVRMTVYNNGSTSLGNVTPSDLVLLGATSELASSGPTPNKIVSLAPGSSGAFEWTYTLSGAVGSTYAFTGTATAKKGPTTNVAHSNWGEISAYAVVIDPILIGSGAPTPLTLAFTVYNNGGTDVKEVDIELPTGWTYQNGTCSGGYGGDWECKLKGGSTVEFKQKAGQGSRLPSGESATFYVTFSDIPEVTSDTPYNFPVTIIDVYNNSTTVNTQVTITAYRLSMGATPSTIPANGYSTSAITATLRSDSSPIVGATVQFATTVGTLSPITATTDINGTAVVTLTAPVSTIIRTAYVEATYLDAWAQTVVTFTPGAAEPNPLYVGGTLSPIAVGRGQTVTFTLDVSNEGGQPVTLATSSVFTFTDGTYTFSANLAAPMLVPTDTQRTLTFTAATVNASFAPGEWQSWLYLVDTDGGAYPHPPRYIDDVTVATMVQFSSATYSVDENVVTGLATITVTLDAASTVTVTVTYATGDGTATAPDDYGSTGGTLSFPPGETSRTFTVSIVDDSDVEGNETINLALGNPANAFLGTPSAAVLIIIEDDVPLVDIDKAVSPSTAQDGQVVTYTYTISITNNGASTIKVQQTTDTLPAGFTYITTTLTIGNPSTITVSGQNITWSYESPHPSIDSDETVTMTFVVTSSVGGGTYCNSVGVTVWKDTVFAEDGLACVTVAWPVYEIVAESNGQTIRVRVRLEDGKPVILSWEVLP